MPQALVTTKLHAPRARPNLVARPRLRDALASGEGRRLTLVSAPAGFGKTTLLGEWAEDLSGAGRSLAWVSLDGSDNDPARFLAYLVGALRAVEEGVGDGIVASQLSPEPPPVEAVMGSLVNDLANARHEVVVVLDDYHVVDSEPIHEALSFLLEHLPENAHLIVSSRTDPPLPLPKLRETARERPDDRAQGRRFALHARGGERLPQRCDGADPIGGGRQRGIELAEQAREVSNLVWGYVTLSRVKRARGEEGALESAREAERVARTSGADLQIAIVEAWMARLGLARGDLAETAASEQEHAANADNASDAVRTMDRLTSARLLNARGQHREELRLLEESRESAETAGHTDDLIEILTLQALARWAKNDKEKAVSTLTQALAMAEPEGYVRTFVDEGPIMGDLLSATLEARQRGHLDAGGRVSVSYLAKLLAAVAQDASAADERLSEPLSERELEVLALIAAGNSNGEIAGKLFVTTSTIKTHVNNLYHKLGVRSRTQAVARA